MTNMPPNVKNVKFWANFSSFRSHFTFFTLGGIFVMFKTHKDSVHGDVWYTCDLCDYKAKRKDNLKTHIDD